MVLIFPLWFFKYQGKDMQFPSPCGDYGSYLEDVAEDVTDIINEFPSPCGDYGSYHVNYLTVVPFPSMFPSPCGDYGSYPTMIIMKTRICTVCFRPLAGIMVLINLSVLNGYVMAAVMVSVPLRGLWFLSACSVC